MISHTFFSTFISLVICHLTTSLILPSQQSSMALKHQDLEVGGIPDLLDLIKTEFDKQNDRIALLEVQNRNQDKDINLLKIDNSKIHDRIDSMSDEVEHQNNDAGSSFYNNATNENVIPSAYNLKRQNQKRAARLIPLTLLFNGKENVSVPTIPFNCTDLNKMGHTVNGIYLVKGNSSDYFGVNVVLCNFQPVAQKSSPLPPITEDRLGFLNLKPTSNSASSSEGIFFYVQRGNKGLISDDGVIRFPREQLNIGKAMDISRGVFTAPKSGIYSFSFSVAKHVFDLTAPLYIYLRVNGIKKGFSSVSAGPLSASAVMAIALKLKKGDRVDLWKEKEGTLAYNFCDTPCHHFTGWLLKELE